LLLFSFGGYGLALAALALVVFGAIECSPGFLCIALDFNGKGWLAEINKCFDLIEEEL